MVEYDSVDEDTRSRIGWDGLAISVEKISRTRFLSNIRSEADFKVCTNIYCT